MWLGKRVLGAASEKNKALCYPLLLADLERITVFSNQIPNDFKGLQSGCCAIVLLMQCLWQQRCPTLVPCHLWCCMLVQLRDTADVQIGHPLLAGHYKQPQSCVWVFNGSWRSPKHVALTSLSVSSRQQHCSSWREGKGQEQCWCCYFCTLLIKLLALTVCSRRALREIE